MSSTRKSTYSVDDPACKTVPAHLVLLNDVDHRPPPGAGVPVEGVDHGLGDAVKQLVWLHLRLPQRLRHTHQLLLAGPARHKVSRLSDAT